MRLPRLRAGTYRRHTENGSSAVASTAPHRASRPIDHGDVRTTVGPGPRGVSMAQRSINGFDLWYEDSGGDGEVILFHHGYTGSHDSWPPIVEQLRGEYRCVMMDSRGAGDSGHPDDGYTIE